MRSIVADLSTAQIFDAPTVNQGGTNPAGLKDSRRGGPTSTSGGGGGAVVYFGGRHREVLRKAGWSRADVQEYIAEHLGRTIGDIRARGYNGGRIRPDQLDEEFIGRIQDPKYVVVLSAGGEGSYSMIDRGGTHFGGGCVKVPDPV
jgi:hypothetical protein